MATHWTESLFVEKSRLFAADLEGRVEDASGEVSDLLDLLAEHYDHEPTTALDVACGIGRHVVELAERGVEPTGVDLSEPFLERARELAEERGLGERTAFRQCDVRDLEDFPGRYDLLTNVYTSFGFFDDETNELVLDAMFGLTAPGGVLAMELANKDGILADFRDANVGTHAGMRYAETTSYAPRRSRTHTERWVYDAETDEFEDHYEYDVRLYSPAELARLLERAGYHEVTVFASFDGTELERESTRMLVLTRRPAA